MMLPGVEIARKRRIHGHKGPHGHVSQPRGPLDHSSMAEPALAARIRLEEKLRGSAGSTPPSNSSSRWSQFLCDGTANIPGQQNKTLGIIKETTSEWTKLIIATAKPTVGDISMSKSSASKADELCAVEKAIVRGKKKVTQLPCYHRL